MDDTVLWNLDVLEGTDLGKPTKTFLGCHGFSADEKRRPFLAEFRWDLGLARSTKRSKGYTLLQGPAGDPWIVIDASRNDSLYREEFVARNVRDEPYGEQFVNSSARVFGIFWKSFAATLRRCPPTMIAILKVSMSNRT